MDGYLFDVSHSLFRGEPSPAVNEEWDRVSQLGPMVFSQEDVIKIGKDPEVVVKLPDSWGKCHLHAQLSKSFPITNH